MYPPRLPISEPAPPKTQEFVSLRGHAARLSGGGRFLWATLSLSLSLALPWASAADGLKRISQEELRDKISGYWIGQLVGNYMGFPFENLYTEEPIPVLIDRYYNFKDAGPAGLRMNLNDRRAYTHIMADALGGAWSDDDTDIEFVTLHAVEAYGLELDYEQLTGMWKRHVNRFIWSSARAARDLMEEGLVPPATGSKKHNPNWYRITSQLMTEIWGAFYPGMTAAAAERAEWNARVLTDDWAVHPDIVYCVMYSAAFFEDDPRRLVELAASRLPEDSPYRRGIGRLLQWSEQHEDWRETRRLLHQEYYEQVEGFEVPFPVAGSIINGLSGIMAILYGDGDFLRTIAIATSAGYDCDNQAATCGGLLGIALGGSSIPSELTRSLPSRGSWDEPFNNQYINYTRDGLPNLTLISDIVERILVVAETAILERGGRRLEIDGKTHYEVQTDLL